MNAAVHAKLSCSRAKTESQKDFDFFYKVHDFMDCSKEVESSNLHRCLTHHLAWVKRIVIPIFGHSYTCENGAVVNLKDDMETNHILADFSNKFIPTLTDYASLIKDDDGDKRLFLGFHNRLNLDQNSELFNLLMSPYYNTGMTKSLWITHNSWFCGEILPKLGFASALNNFVPHGGWEAFSPSIMFNRMRYDNWVQNGNGYPPSFEKIKDRRERNRGEILAKMRD